MLEFMLDDMQSEAFEIQSTLSECSQHLDSAVSCETKEDCVTNLKELRASLKEALKAVSEILNQV